MVEHRVIADDARQLFCHINVNNVACNCHGVAAFYILLRRVIVYRPAAVSFSDFCVTMRSGFVVGFSVFVFILTWKIKELFYFLIALLMHKIL